MRYAVTCLLFNCKDRSNFLHTISVVHASSEAEARGFCVEKDMRDHPEFALHNVIVVPL